MFLLRNSPGSAIRYKLNLWNMELKCFTLTLSNTQQILETRNGKYHRNCFNRSNCVFQYFVFHHQNTIDMLRKKIIHFDRINDSRTWDNLTEDKLK